MRAFGEVEIYDGRKLPFGFIHSDGITKLTLGDDGVCFQMQVPDHEAESNIARLDLPKELAIAATAKAVFEQAYLQGHMSRDGAIGQGSPFPDISAQVRAGRVVPNDIRPVHSVWARRFTT